MALDASFFGASDRGPQPFFNGSAPDGVQAKLKVGQPGDKYEREADSVADRVVRQINTPGETHADAPGIQRVSRFEADEQLQERVSGEEETQNDVQRKPIFESEGIQTQSDGGDESEPPGDLSSRLGSSTSGDPLPNDTRENMESAIGADLSRVRVHTDANAVQLSRDLGAQAFTHGNDIYFNEGKYHTNTTAGKHLLAHELTHTVQQGGSDIQKATNNKNDNLVEDINEISHKNGKIEKHGTSFKITLFNYPVKKSHDSSGIQPPFVFAKAKGILIKRTFGKML